MRWNEIVTEGVDIECPNCGEHVGKAKELPKGTVTCGQCGDKISNPYGYEHSRSQDQKFGRLSLTDLSTEEGTTQGTLRSKDGKALGSLIQYGHRWDGYDNGNWEAYCNAAKKRKKGFKTKELAVQWIVRQTRVAQKAAMGETVMDEAADDPMIFGRTVPNWDHEDERGDAAFFQGDPMYQAAQVLQRNGNYEVWISTEDHYKFPSAGDAENLLKKYGFIHYDYWEDFNPQKPEGV